LGAIVDYFPSTFAANQTPESAKAAKMLEQMEAVGDEFYSNRKKSTLTETYLAQRRHNTIKEVIY
jgi:hypothetical protein